MMRYRRKSGFRRTERLRRLPPLLLPFLLLLLPAPLGAAQTEPARICLFLPSAEGANAETRDHEALIAESLAIELAAIGYRIVPGEEWMPVLRRRGLAPQELADNGTARAVAEEVSADLAFVASVLAEDGRLFFQLKVIDVSAGVQLAAVLRSGRAGLTAYNVVNRAVADTHAAMGGAGGGPDGRRIPGDALVGVLDHGIVERVVLESAQEGMEISFAGEPLGRIENGSLLLPFAPFPVGSEVVLTKRLAGHHSGRQTIRLPEKEVRVALEPLRKRAAWGAELNWTTGQSMGAGIGVRRYLLPDELYLSLDGYFSVQHDFRDGSRAVYHEDLRLLLGWYLFGRPDSDFRFALTGGAGVIFSSFGRSGLGSYTDWYLNLFNPTVELNLDPVGLYWRPEFRLALGVGRNLLGRRMILVDERGPLWTVGAVYRW